MAEIRPTPKQQDATTARSLYSSLALTLREAIMNRNFYASSCNPIKELIAYVLCVFFYEEFPCPPRIVRSIQRLCPPPGRTTPQGYTVNEFLKTETYDKRRMRFVEEERNEALKLATDIVISSNDFLDARVWVPKSRLWMFMMRGEYTPDPGSGHHHFSLLYECIAGLSSMNWVMLHGPGNEYKEIPCNIACILEERFRKMCPGPMQYDVHLEERAMPASVVTVLHEVKNGTWTKLDKPKYVSFSEYKEVYLFCEEGLQDYANTNVDTIVLFKDFAYTRSLTEADGAWFLARYAAPHAHALGDFSTSILRCLAMLMEGKLNYRVAVAQCFGIINAAGTGWAAAVFENPVKFAQSIENAVPASVTEVELLELALENALRIFANTTVFVCETEYAVRALHAACRCVLDHVRGSPPVDAIALDPRVQLPFCLTMFAGLAESANIYFPCTQASEDAHFSPVALSDTDKYCTCCGKPQRVGICNQCGAAYCSLECFKRETSSHITSKRHNRALSINPWTTHAYGYRSNPTAPL